MGTGIGLDTFNVNRHPRTLKLVVDVDDAVLHIQVPEGQSTELGNSHSGVGQHENYLIVLAVDIVVMNEFQELSHLIRFDRLTGNAVIYYHPGKLKTERILQDQIIVYCHLEDRSQNTADCFHGTVRKLPIVILLINANSRCVKPPFAIIRAYCF